MRLITPAEIQPLVRIANYHAVAPLHCWNNRRIPDLQLILVIAGEFAYTEVNRPPLPVQAGEVLLIEPGQVHTFCHTTPAGTGLISGIHLELTPVGSWLLGDYRLTVTPERITRVGDVAYLHERFRRLATVYNSYTPYRMEQLSAIAREVVLLLAGHWGQPATARLSPRMAEMLKFIRTNLAGPLSRQTLAADFNLSPQRINVLFQQELGMSPSAVINRERIMAAYRLIHEQGQSVKEAAYAVGFADQFYFSRVFKAIFGVPPSQVG
jgi:AraC family transcriptional regulator, transcriptional activator for feuABC-ybbA operon